MFKQAEITQMTRIRNDLNEVTKIINRVVIMDYIYGNLYSEIICEGEDLSRILSEPQDQHATLFQEWITPKIQEIYEPWFISKEKEKLDTLYPSDIEQKFGLLPIITSF